MYFLKLFQMRWILIFGGVIVLWECIKTQFVFVRWFYILQFYSIHLLVLTSFSGVFRVLCKRSYHIQTENFTFSSLICVTFVYFLPIYLARTSSTILIKCCKSGHICLVPDFRRKDLIFSLLNDVSCRLIIYVFYYAEVHSSVKSIFILSCVSVTCAFFSF